jgi:alpha-tubulin suppressor-like RCC1 family protein
MPPLQINAVTRQDRELTSNARRSVSLKRSAVFFSLLLVGILSSLIILLAPIGFGGRGSSDGGKKIIAIAAGTAHSLALDKDGKVYAAGWNKFGQLGLGDSGTGTNREVFTDISSLRDKNITSIAAGYFHSFAIDSDGRTYATGNHKFGRRGLGDRGRSVKRYIFTLISSLKDKNITAVAAGKYHALALDSDGRVYATGDNEVDRLGLGDKSDRERFTEVSSLKRKKIIAIAAGHAHSLALDNDGRVYATGSNKDEQLGLGDKTDRERFTEVSSLKSKKIIAIAASQYHSIALADDGKVYVTGYEYLGRLGLGDKLNSNSFNEASSLSGKKIIAIAAGYIHSIALADDGKVYVTGFSMDGQLGLGDKILVYTFTEVPSLKDKVIIAIAAGLDYSLVLDGDGGIYATGSNYCGELGLGDSGEDADRDVFTKVRF